jgi:pyrrolysyl-tRNA synthetase-like protein
MSPGDGIAFTVTQRQRLRELGAVPADADTTFADAATRDLRFKELERRLTAYGRRRLQELRDGARSPALCALADKLRAVLTGGGFVEVVTPHIVSADSLLKMGIPSDDPLAEQIFWLDGARCLRPMLAPNLYTVMRRLGRVWSRPFGIFEVGTCFRRDSHGSQHLNEFTMLNAVELGTPLEQRRPRLEALAALVLAATGIDRYELETVDSGVYGDTVDVVVDGVEVCSTAMGPHPLDDAWGITETWVGLGFGLERLLVARDAHQNIERVARSLSYLDGVRLHL